MKRNSIWLVAVALVVAGVTTAVAASDNFRTHLSGDEEVQVPAVVTGAQGQATFKLSDDGQSITYKLNVANIENVTQAHIHLAPAGQNGGIVVWLYPSAPPQILIPGRTNGNLAEGTITAANLIGTLTGQPLSVLLDANPRRERVRQRSYKPVPARRDPGQLRSSRRRAAETDGESTMRSPATAPRVPDHSAWGGDDQSSVSLPVHGSVRCQHHAVVRRSTLSW